LEDARTLPDGYDPVANIGGYRFTASIANAGAYQLSLVDNVFPNQFASLKALVSQGGTLTQAVSAPGSTATPALAVGTVTVLVFGSPSNATANSLFGVSLKNPAAAAPVLDQAQGVGGLFQSLVVTVPSSGSYDLTVNDLKFPSSLQDLSVALTQGSSLRAQVFGSGTITFTANPGTYALNILTKLVSGATFGTWGYVLANTPVAPTVALSASPSSVTSQQTSSLTWSATDATACTASGGWSGPRAVSGVEVTPVLTATSNFTLTCTGSGGSATRTVTVAVTPARSIVTGGGTGGMDGLLLAALAALVCFRAAMGRLRFQRGQQVSE
jgi:hypothetical protein